jgi:hypothetical protein
MHKIGLLAVLLALLAISCSNTVSTGQPASPQLIFSLDGAGDPAVGMTATSTDNFHVSKTEWFIETTCEALDASNSVGLTVTVYPKGKTADFEYIGAFSQNSPGSDKNYFHDTGDFYLTIVAMNVKTWSIRIYQ